MPENRKILLIGLIILFAVTGPYLYAYFQTGDGYHFGGFLFNPTDGNSYLAKMRQGLEGEWKFKLPYTAEPGDGGYLFLFYLGLGHLSRLLGLPLIITFHLARVLGAVFMLWSLKVFFDRIFTDPLLRFYAFLTAAVGSGLGWLGVFFDLFTMDFWVAESYPFLSAYASPHFSFGLGLILILAAPGYIKSPFLAGSLSAALGVIQPFGVVVLAAVLVGEMIGDFLKTPVRKLSSWLMTDNYLAVKTFFSILGGGLIILYQFLVIKTDPVLSQWNAQNQTPSPPIWDLILGLSPCLLFAVLGGWRIWKTQRHVNLLIWLVLTLFLAYIPWNLQRRFLTGIMVPASGMAVIGFAAISERHSLKINRLIAGLMVVIIPTNVIIVFSGVQAAANHDPAIILRREEIQALEWIENNIPSESLILADARFGQLIPAYTGSRVIYGHPFETTEADRKRQVITEIFQGKLENSELKEMLNNQDVDYVLINDLQLWGLEDEAQFGRAVYNRDGIRIVEIEL